MKGFFWIFSPKMINVWGDGHANSWLLFCTVWDWTQDLSLLGKHSITWILFKTLLLMFCFGDRVSLTLPRLALNFWSTYLCPLRSWDYSMCHHTQLHCWHLLFSPPYIKLEKILALCKCKLGWNSHNIIGFFI
jgi:hypothetical protein